MFKGAIDGGRIWWVAPSYPTIESSQIWEDLKKATCDAWIEKNEVTRTVELPGGGSISVRSADKPDSLRGPGLDGLIIDEAAFVKVDAWLHALRPALSDKQGWCMMLTTPNGKNWIHDSFKRATGRPDWNAWQLPSWQNPLIPASEIDALKIEQGPRKFAQEIGAQFTEIEGAIFPSVYFEDHIWSQGWPLRFEVSAIAVDPSMGANEQSDLSAIVFIGLNEGLLFVDSDIRRRPPMQLVEDTASMYDRYLPQTVGIEAIAFQGVLAPLLDLWCQQKQRLPLPVSLIKHAPKEKKEIRVLRLDPYFCNQQIRLKQSDSNNVLLEQLMMFPDSGYHDDGPDALEMALRLLIHVQNGGEQTSEPIFENVYA